MTGSAFVLRAVGRSLAPGSAPMEGDAPAPGDVSPRRVGSAPPSAPGEDADADADEDEEGGAGEPGDDEDAGETTTGPPRSGSSPAARTSPTEAMPAAEATSTRRSTVPRCFMGPTLTPFEETTLKPR